MTYNIINQQYLQILYQTYSGKFDRFCRLFQMNIIGPYRHLINTVEHQSSRLRSDRTIDIFVQHRLVRHSFKECVDTLCDSVVPVGGHGPVLF
jgi:hypothetical protein